MEEKHNLISLPHYGIIRTIVRENEKHHISLLLNYYIFYHQSTIDVLIYKCNIHISVFKLVLSLDLGRLSGFHMKSKVLTGTAKPIKNFSHYHQLILLRDPHTIPKITHKGNFLTQFPYQCKEKKVICYKYSLTHFFWFSKF